MDARSTETALMFLRVFDSITFVRDDGEGDWRVKATSQAALYFLRSLAEYVRQNLKLVSNWEREGTVLSDVFSSGARFLYAMESKRIEQRETSTAIREQSVSKAVIKARVHGRREPAYLVQLDQAAGAYQLIGGRRRSSDEDACSTMQREIEEELARNDLKYKRDFDLNKLSDGLLLKKLSPTYGAYSEYDMAYYQAFIWREQLILGPDDKWVSLSELMSGKTRAGEPIFEALIEKLDAELPGGLKHLPFSLDNKQNQVQNGSIGQRLWPNNWQKAGFFLGVVGIVVTIAGIVLALVLR